MRSRIARKRRDRHAFRARTYMDARTPAGLHPFRVARLGRTGPAAEAHPTGGSPAPSATASFSGAQPSDTGERRVSVLALRDADVGADAEGQNEGEQRAA